MPQYFSFYERINSPIQFDSGASFASIELPVVEVAYKNASSLPIVKSITGLLGPAIYLSIMVEEYDLISSQYDFNLRIKDAYRLVLLLWKFRYAANSIYC